MLYPRLVSGNTATFIQWNPILVSSEGTDFNTNSVFLNDKWRLNDHWSFNLGVRYDKNDGANSEGQKTAKDSRVSPRLSATLDPKADGNLVFNASYDHYVNALANSQGDATSRGGNPASIRWFYRGPSINVDPNAPLIPTSQAIQQIFDWFASTGGTNNTSNLRSVSIPGGTAIIRGSLDSPYAEEYAFGFSKRLGTRGLFRTDYVHRSNKSFYYQETDRITGQVTAPTGQRADLTVLTNSDKNLDRLYDGLLTQFQLRLSDRLNVGGFWTLAHLRGTVEGENAGSGPISSTIGNYPEYQDIRWSNPRGDLSADQRHRIRIWALYDILRGDRHTVSVSVLQNFASGTPYGAVGLVDTRPYVTNPGYALPPSSVPYYYTSRDQFHTQDVTATDLALNYSFRVASWGQGVEIYVQPQILNVFNEHAVINVNQAVRDPTTTSALQRFNPFTTVPVEGLNWQKGPNFGKPVRQEDYQLPRTFQFSVGLRF